MNPIAWLLRLLLVPVLRRLTGFFHSLQDKRRGLGTADWHRVNGRIETVNVHSNRHDNWVVMLYYSYSANGEYWSGSTFRRFFTERDADAYAQEHPSGSIVVVRYRPSKVSKSVVLKQDQLSASAAGSI